MLETAQLIDSVFQLLAFLVEDLDLGAVTALGLFDDPGCRGVALGDQCIALPDAFTDVFLVQTAS